MQMGSDGFGHRLLRPGVTPPNARLSFLWQLPAGPIITWQRGSRCWSHLFSFLAPYTLPRDATFSFSSGRRNSLRPAAISSSIVLAFLRPPHRESVSAFRRALFHSLLRPNPFVTHTLQLAFLPSSIIIARYFPNKQSRLMALLPRLLLKAQTRGMQKGAGHQAVSQAPCHSQARYAKRALRSAPNPQARQRAVRSSLGWTCPAPQLPANCGAISTADANGDGT